MSKSLSPRLLSFTALFLALAVVLPIGFHAMGIGGRVFLPMHIPVLLAGFLAGPLAGFIVGLLAPGLSTLLTGMPPAVITPVMTLELPLYGLTAGLFYYRMHLNIYIALGISMILGRLAFALGLFILGFFIDMPYSAAALFSSGSAFITGLPGIIVQIIIIPVIVAAVKRNKTLRFSPAKNIFLS